MSKILLLLLICNIVLAQQQTCQQYITNIIDQFKQNKTEAQLTVALYLVLSGKYLEDLGFPEKCMTTPNTTYTTLEFESDLNGQNITTYYGLCFNQVCDAQTILSNKNLIITFLNVVNITNITDPDSFSFGAVTPRLQHSIHPAAIVFIVLFSLLVALEMAYSIRKWVNQCSNEQVAEQRYTFQDGLIYQEEQMSFLRKISLEYKFSQFFSPAEKTNKIISFSCFKIICIPLMIVGQQFYFRNLAAYNLFSFKEQIYETFYSKVAVFSVYLPDVLFFISAYLLATKCLQHSQNINSLLQYIFTKFIRLYPIYIAILVIYWVISPAIHQGPVWYVYQNKTNVCNSRWWAAFLLIDNWFDNNCYSGAWFIQAEFQFVIFTLVFFFFFSKFKMASIIVYLLTTIVMLVLTIVISSKMPISIENSVSQQFRTYFTSTHAHFFFYLLGMGMALLKKIENISSKITTHFQNSKITQILIQCVGLGLILLVLFRPSIWSGGSEFQFALSRIGVFVGFLTFFIGGIFKPQEYENSSILHRLAYYSYPVMLIAPVITLSSVWGLSSFYYMNGLDLMNLMITESILSILVGGLLGFLLQSNIFKSEA